MLLPVQLKDAPSPGFADNAAGEVNYGLKDKKSGKNRKKC
jgi:hypothetical protein